MAQDYIETVDHIVTECMILAQKKIQRHDNIARLVRWKLCGKYKMNKSEKWYEHMPEAVVENEWFKIYWDFNIQCDKVTEHRRHDIIVVE